MADSSSRLFLNKPENVKLLLESYIKCKQNEDVGEGEVGYRDLLIQSADFFARMMSPTASLFFGALPPILGHGAAGSSGYILSHIWPFEQEPVRPENVIQAGRNLARMAEDFSNAQPERSIIKFKDICMVKEPTEQIISVSVIRDQSFSNNVTRVSWETCDKTAITGSHYVGSSGEIIFNQGDTRKEIQIKILNSPDAAEDLRFIVKLRYEGMLHAPLPMTISLKDLPASEKSLLSHLPCSLPFTVSHVKSALDTCLNSRTFHIALTHLCSTTSDVHLQFALACQLSYLCLRGSAMSRDAFVRILTDFFRMDDYS